MSLSPNWKILHKKLAGVYQDVKDPNQEAILFSLEQHFGNAYSLIEIVDDSLLQSMTQYEREFRVGLGGKTSSDRF